MRYIQRINMLSVAALVSMVLFSCTIPMDLNIKGSPNYELPVGKADYTLTEFFDFKSLLSQSLSSNFKVEIKQSDVVSDFGLPSLSLQNIPEQPGGGTVTFSESDSTRDPIEITTDTYSEVEFSSGRLNADISMSGLTPGVEVTITDAAIVDPNDGYSEITPAMTSSSFTADGSGAGSTTVSFDLTDKTLPNTFAFEITMTFSDGTFGNEFDIDMTPSISDFTLSRISGVSIDPAVSDSGSVNDLSFALPDYLSGAVIEEGNLILGVDTPDQWDGFILDLGAALEGTDGAETDRSTATDPELSLPLDGMEFDGTAWSLDWTYSLDDASGGAEFTFDSAGIAVINGTVDLQITDMTLTVKNDPALDADGSFWTDESGSDLIYEANGDLFNREAVDPDGAVEQILDGVESASVNIENIVNMTGLELTIVIMDSSGTFEKSIELSNADSESTVILTEQDIIFMKENPFILQVKVFIPAGELNVVPDGELSFNMWMSLATDINYTVPLGSGE